MVLVHRDRDPRIELGGGEHQVAEVIVLAEAAGTAGRLHDHRRLRLLGRLHDRLDLLHVVHVEGGDAIPVLGGVIEQDAHGNERHGSVSDGGREGLDCWKPQVGPRKDGRDHTEKTDVIESP